LKWPRNERFIFDVQPGEFLSGGGEGREVGGERNAWKFALEVGGVTLAVVRMVEQGVNVVEDVFLRDGVVGVVLVEVIDG
jgi:hypothetical protein